MFQLVQASQSLFLINFGIDIAVATNLLILGQNSKYKTCSKLKITEYVIKITL